MKPRQSRKKMMSTHNKILLASLGAAGTLGALGAVVYLRPASQFTSIQAKIKSSEKEYENCMKEYLTLQDVQDIKIRKLQKMLDDAQSKVLSSRKKLNAKIVDYYKLKKPHDITLQNFQQRGKITGGKIISGRPTMTDVKTEDLVQHLQNIDQNVKAPLQKIKNNIFECKESKREITRAYEEKLKSILKEIQLAERKAAYFQYQYQHYDDYINAVKN
jgi:hypothetical protein